MPTPAVVEVETLPDGRELRVLADGRVVVAGAAGPRPHPIPGAWWTERTPSRPRAARPTTRRRASSRTRPLRVDDGPRWDPAEDAARQAAAARAREVAHGRADELLRSFLEPDQLADYARTGGFWVEVPDGRVRLGRLYALEYAPRVGRRQTLCVVPRHHHTLPLPDIWTNLLLVLRHDPEEFFRVAVRR